MTFILSKQPSAVPRANRENVAVPATAKRPRTYIWGSAAVKTGMIFAKNQPKAQGLAIYYLLLNIYYLDDTSTFLRVICGEKHVELRMNFNQKRR